MSQLLHTEDIVWAVVDALSNELAQALADVEARRTRDAFDIPLPVEIELGSFDDLVFNLPNSAFPRIAVVGAPRDPDDVALGEGVGSATHMLIIEWLHLVPDKRQATLLAWRYGEAIAQVILTMGPIAGFEPTTPAFRVTEGQATPHKDRDRASTIRGYLSGGIATIPLRGEVVS
jgi:hypothetical protein